VRWSSTLSRPINKKSNSEVGELFSGRSWHRNSRTSVTEDQGKRTLAHHLKSREWLLGQVLESMKIMYLRTILEARNIRVLHAYFLLTNYLVLTKFTLQTYWNCIGNLETLIVFLLHDLSMAKMILEVIRELMTFIKSLRWPINSQLGVNHFVCELCSTATGLETLICAKHTKHLQLRDSKAVLQNLHSLGPLLLTEVTELQVKCARLFCLEWTTW
jgi:hypothetical protein